MRGNTITYEVPLKRGKSAKTIPLYQYDYGQKLIFTGVVLPYYYEVHFSNTMKGEAVTSIGDSTGVEIPDAVLASGEPVYFWLFLHDDDTDGETEYQGVIPVIKKALPTDQEPTPVQASVIQQAINALNDGIETAVAEASAATIDAQHAAEAARDAAQAAAGNFQGMTAEAEGLDADEEPTIEVTHSEGGMYNFDFGIPKGATFTPSVDASGDLSWTNDGGMENPETVNIKGPQGDPAPEEEVVAAVEDWLDDHIDPLTADPPLDSSLTQSNAAAPANLVGELKSALEQSEIFGEETVQFTTNNDYAVSSDSGELVSLSGMRYTIIDLTNVVYQSITFKTSAYGGNYGYGFILSDNSWSGVHTTATGTVTVNVPVGAKTFKTCWNPSSVSTQEITAVSILEVKKAIENVAEKTVSMFETSEIYDDGNIDFTVKNDYCVSSETGALVSVSGMRYTIISLTDKKYISLTFKTSAYGGNYGYGFMLSNGTWTGVHTVSSTTVTVDVPNNAVEFRLCWNPSSVATQSIQGVSFVKVGSSLDDLEEKTDGLKSKFELKSKYDVSGAITGYGISSETGSIETLAPGAYIIIDLTGKEYKSIKFKTTAFGGNYGYGFVLSDNSWDGVHTIANETVTANVPNGAKTFKLCWNFNNLPIAQQDVEEDYYTTAEDIVALIDEKVSMPNAYPLSISTTLDITSEAPVVVPAYNVDSDIYSRYDDLAEDYPDWVTKIDTSDADSEIGTTKPSYLSGLSIYMYKFSAKRTNITETNKRLRVMITTGTHPMEAMGIFNVFYFFKWINENWRTNDTALQLRTMVDFYVIPCVCPLGYNDILRTNRPVADGGVNINRNFPTKNWTLSGSGTADYSGATAGSEYETKIVMYYANEIKPHIYFDAHTGSMPNGRYGCMELNGETKGYVVDFAYSYAMGLIKDWICNNTDFPQYIDENPLFNVNVSNVYTGAAFRWFEENITDYSFLTEESINNYWRNGVLTTSNPETGTARIFNENFKAVYGAIVWAIYCACKGYQIN